MSKPILYFDHALESTIIMTREVLVQFYQQIVAVSNGKSALKDALKILMESPHKTTEEEKTW